MNAIDLGPPLVRLKAFYASIARERLDAIAELYAPNAYFRDPFNEVRGEDEIRRIMERMLDTLDDCRFDFVDEVVDARGAFLTWDFRFRIGRWRRHVPHNIHGGSHLRFDARGRVAYHRDYWDAAGELYEKLPAIGGVMRVLRRRLG